MDDNSQLDGLAPFRPVQKIKFRKPSSSKGFQRPILESSESEIREQTADLVQTPVYRDQFQRIIAIQKKNFSNKQFQQREKQDILNAHSNSFLANTGLQIANRRPSQNFLDDNRENNQVFDQDMSKLLLNQKLRDLEGLIMDVQGNLQRKINKLAEENPKYLNNIKQLEGKQIEAMQVNSQKFVTLNQNFHHLQNMIFKQNNQIDTLQHALNNKLSIFESRLKHAQINQENNAFSQFNNKFLPIENGDANNNNSFKGVSQVENQMNFLQQSVQQDLISKENTINDLKRQLKETQQRMVQQEKDLLGKVQKLKENITIQNRSSTSHSLQRDRAKFQRLQNDYEQLQITLVGVQKRMDEESQQKVKQQVEERIAIEKKMSLIRDEIKNEEKTILSGEQSLAEHFIQSINSLKDLIRINKQEVESNLQATQTLFGQNVKSLSSTLDLVRNGFILRMSQFEKALLDTSNRLRDTQEQMSDHFTHVNTLVDKQQDQVRNLELDVDKKLKYNHDNTVSAISKLQKENEGLFETFERQNLAVFTEVSNALKSLKVEISKEQKDSIQRMKDFREELNSFQSVNENMLQNLDEHTKHMDQQIEFQINENKVEVQSHLQNQIEQMQKLLADHQETYFETTAVQIEAETTQLDQQFQSQINSALTDVNAVHKQTLNDTINALETRINQDKIQNNDSIKSLQKEFKQTKEELLTNLEKKEKSINDFQYQINDNLRDVREEILTDIGKMENSVYVELSSRFENNQRKMDTQLKESEKRTDRLIEDLQLKNDNTLNANSEKIKDYVNEQINDVFQNQCILEITKERSSRLANESKISIETQNTKNMLLEALHQKSETVKAVARALINEESTERMAFFQELSKSLNQNINNIDKSLRTLIGTQTQGLRMETKQSLNDFQNQIQQFKLNSQKKMDDMNEAIFINKTEFEAESYTNQILRKQITNNFEDFTRDVQLEILSILKQRQRDAVVVQTLRHAIDLTCDNMQNVEIDIEQLQINIQNSLALIEEVQQEAELIQKEGLDNSQLIKDTNTVLTQLKEEVKHNSEQFDAFVNKTSQNFKMTEEIINSHTQFLNSTDSHLMIESIQNQLQIDHLEEIILSNLNQLKLEAEDKDSNLKAEMVALTGVIKTDMELQKKDNEIQLKAINNQLEQLVPLQEEVKKVETQFQKDIATLKSENDVQTEKIKEELLSINQIQNDINQLTSDTQTEFQKNKIENDFQSQQIQEELQEIGKLKTAVEQIEKDNANQLTLIQQEMDDIQLIKDELKNVQLQNEKQTKDIQKELEAIDLIQQDTTEITQKIKQIDQENTLQTKNLDIQQQEFQQIQTFQQEDAENISLLKIEVNNLKDQLEKQTIKEMQDNHSQIESRLSDLKIQIDELSQKVKAA